MGFLKWTVRITIASIFFYVGSVKFVPAISQDYHSHLSKEFAKFATVFPSKLIGLEITGPQLMRLIGTTEVICAPLLMIGSKPFRNISNLAFTMILVSGLYCLYGLRYNASEYIPSIFGLALIYLDTYVLDDAAGGSAIKRD